MTGADGRGEATGWARVGDRSSLHELIFRGLRTLGGEVRMRCTQVDRTHQSWCALTVRTIVGAVEDAAATLAANVRRTRLDNLMTQEEVAGRAMMDTAELGKIERGERRAGTLVVARIAYALDVPMSTLYEGAGWRPPS